MIMPIIIRSFYSESYSCLYPSQNEWLTEWSLIQLFASITSNITHCCLCLTAHSTCYADEWARCSHNWICCLAVTALNGGTPDLLLQCNPLSLLCSKIRFFKKTLIVTCLEVPICIVSAAGAAKKW